MPQHMALSFSLLRRPCNSHTYLRHTPNITAHGSTVELPPFHCVSQLEHSHKTQHYPLPAIHCSDLSNNSFSGSLPQAWASLSALEDLNLGNNDLSGTLPPAWSALAGLQALELGWNRLQGELPASWSGMALLQVGGCTVWGDAGKSRSM